jgi:tRNA(fMet)-specific endonuclease VapC
MKIILDTNRYTDLARGDPEAQKVIASAEEVCVPIIVLGELRAGFRAGTKRAENEAALRGFLSQQGVRILLLDEHTSFVYAELATDLRNRGRAIPTNDVWIAALAKQHGLHLYSRDQHFAYLPDLPRA